MDGIRNLQAVILIAAFAASTFPAFGRKTRTKYSQVVMLPFNNFTVGRYCISVLGFISSHDFFKGLEQVRTDTGVQYRRKSKLVQTFPSQIALKIQMDMSQCPSRNQRMPPHTLSQFRKSLQLQIFWDDGSQLRRANFSIVSSHIVPLSSPKFAPFDTMQMWVDEVLIESAEIPLTDNFVAEFVAENGKRVACIGGLVDKCALELTSRRQQ